MPHPHNPQEREMSDASMVRNLAAQIEAIWPQEKPLFAGYALPERARILDIGCGTGELEPLLAGMFAGAEIVGVDLDPAHLERARVRSAAFGARVRFETGDALALAFPDASFDLAVSRHVIHALPDAAKALSEMARVLKPGGRLHVLAEDYGMLFCDPTPRDADGFWHRVPNVYGPATGTDLHIGRKLHALLTDLGLDQISVSYVVADTQRVPREVFARIWEAWRDGYTDSIVQHAGLSRADTLAWWNEMIACVRDPRGYALWLIPIWTAVRRR
jgi:SAM-dependent methyltransferase